MNESTKPQRQVGRRVDRLESRSKVTGTADYTHNLVLPRMLHAKVVRSSKRMRGSCRSTRAPLLRCRACFRS